MILFSNINEGQEIVESAINDKKVHQYYDRTVNLAKEYKTAITGEGFEDWLFQFKKRESDSDFDDRKLFTSKVFVPAISNVTNKFNKLTSIKNITKSIVFVSGDNKSDKVERLLFAEQNMLGCNYEDFVRKFLLPRSHRDPNSFYTILFEKKGKEKLPYIKFFNSSECILFEYENQNELNYLLTKEVFTVKKKNGEVFESEDFTLFAGELVLVYKKILLGVDYGKENVENFYRVGDFSGDVFIDKNKNVYSVKAYNTKSKQVQAFRVGYVLDPTTNESTCISIIDNAMPVIKRFISVVSNADVSRNIHSFPQRMTFVAPCDYRSEEGECLKGELPDGTKCPKCHGTGKKKTESPLDTLEVDFPDDPSQIFDISKLASYVNQSTAIVDFLDKLEQRLEKRIFAAVFNADMTPHSSLTAVGDTVTATEVSTTRSDINDTLILTASMISSFKKWEISLSCNYLFPNESSSILVNYEYPNDLKLSSVEELLNQLQQAKQSNAPYFVIEEITQNISAKLFDGDKKSMNKIALKKKYIPFFEMSSEFVLSGYEKGAINTDDFIVFYNQESIFVDLEEKTPTLYFLPPSEQKKVVTDFISKYLTEFKQKTQFNGNQTKTN